MHFNLEALQQRMQAIVQIQNDNAFVPRSVIEAEKKKRQQAINSENARKEREIIKKVKDIAMARKVKAALETMPAYTDAKLKVAKRDAVDRSFRPTIGALNLEGKVRVQVNSKTWIYIDKDRNPYEAIEAWNLRHASPEQLQKKQQQDFQHISPGMVDMLVALGEI